MIVSSELATLLNVCHAAPLDWQAKLVAADKADEDGLGSCAWWLRWLASHSLSTVLPSRRDIHNTAVPTGSRKYGVPRPDSDWDWVVPIPDWYWHHWVDAKQHADSHSEHKPPDQREAYYESPLLSGTARFGPINMIWVTEKTQWRCWHEGTALLVEQAARLGPRSRETAVECFKGLAEKYL